MPKILGNRPNADSMLQLSGCAEMPKSASSVGVRSQGARRQDRGMPVSEVVSILRTVSRNFPSRLEGREVRVSALNSPHLPAFFIFFLVFVPIGTPANAPLLGMGNRHNSDTSSFAGTVLQGTHLHP